MLEMGRRTFQKACHPGQHHLRQVGFRAHALDLSTVA